METSSSNVAAFCECGESGREALRLTSSSGERAPRRSSSCLLANDRDGFWSAANTNRCTKLGLLAALEAEAEDGERSTKEETVGLPVSRRAGCANREADEPEDGESGTIGAMPTCPGVAEWRKKVKVEMRLRSEGGDRRLSAEEEDEESVAVLSRSGRSLLRGETELAREAVRRCSAASARSFSRG